MQGPVVEGLETINYYETDSDNDSMESEEEVETDDEDDEDRRMEKAWDQVMSGASDNDPALVTKPQTIVGKLLMRHNKSPRQGSHGSHGSHGNLMAALNLEQVKKKLKQGSHGNLMAALNLEKVKKQP